MIPMELRQLKCFVGIADTGGFSEASRVLYISQSAISQQLRVLEEELKTQLFVRNRRNAVLTDSGRELLPLARQILRDADECRARIDGLNGLLRGKLDIGLTSTLEPYVREAMLCFLEAYPRVQVNAHYKSLPELLRMLHDHEIALMLSMMPVSQHDYVESVFLMEYRLAAIMRRSHPLAARVQLTFNDLMHQRLILPERGLHNRNAIESFMHTATGDMKVCSITNDAGAIMNLLQESNCVSILAEHSIANRPSLCHIPIAELNEPVKAYAHFNRSVPRKASVQAFLDLFMHTSAFFTAKK